MASPKVFQDRKLANALYPLARDKTGYHWTRTSLVYQLSSSRTLYLSFTLSAYGYLRYILILPLRYLAIASVARSHFMHGRRDVLVPFHCRHKLHLGKQIRRQRPRSATVILELRGIFTTDLLDLQHCRGNIHLCEATELTAQSHLSDLENQDDAMLESLGLPKINGRYIYCSERTIPNHRLLLGGF